MAHLMTSRNKGDLDLLESGLFGDVIVRCKDKEWKLHKAILCSRSKWFKAALCGGFTEASTGVVTLQELDPVDVDVIVYRIYTGVYPPFLKIAKVTKLAQIYKVADFLQVEEIKSEHLRIFDSILQCFKMLLSSGLQAGCQRRDKVENSTPNGRWYVQDFFAAVKVMQVLPEDSRPRQMFARCAAGVNSWAIKDPEWLSELESVPGFAIDVLKAMSTLPAPQGPAPQVPAPHVPQQN